MFIDMADSDAPAHFIQDLPMPHNGWVFTGPSPTLRLFALVDTHMKLRVEFSLWDVAFRQTGPVELTFRVNGYDLAKVRYDSPGPKIFEQPVPPERLRVGAESTVSITVDKPWVGADGKKFGFILQRAGFVR